MRIHLLFLNILLLLLNLCYRYYFQNNQDQMLNFSILFIFIYPNYDYYVMYNINSYSSQVRQSKIMDCFYLFIYLYFIKNFVYFFVILLNFILVLFFYKDSNLIDLTYQFVITFYENTVQILHNHLLYQLHLIYDIDYQHVDCIVYYCYYCY